MIKESSGFVISAIPKVPYVIGVDAGLTSAAPFGLCRCDREMMWRIDAFYYINYSGLLGSRKLPCQRFFSFMATMQCSAPPASLMMLKDPGEFINTLVLLICWALGVHSDAGCW